MTPSLSTQGSWTRSDAPQRILQKPAVPTRHPCPRPPRPAACTSSSRSVSSLGVSKRDSCPCRPIRGSLGIVPVLLGHLALPLLICSPCRELREQKGAGLGTWLCSALAYREGGFLNPHLSSRLPAPWGHCNYSWKGFGSTEMVRSSEEEAQSLVQSL